jgi:methyl coenzyme M reductase subunit C
VDQRVALVDQRVVLWIEEEGALAQEGTLTEAAAMVK